MPHVRQPLLICLTSKMLTIIGILEWGMWFIPQSAWVCLEEDENLVEAIRASKVVYARPLKIAWGVQHWTLKSNNHNRAKEMDAISKYRDSKIIHGWYIFIPIYIYIYCLHLNIGIFFFFFFLC